MIPNLGTPNDTAHTPDVNVRMGQISAAQQPTPEPPSPSGQSRPQTTQPTKDTADHPRAMAAFIESKLNMAGGQRMGGRNAKPGYTNRTGPYAGLTTTQATERIKQEWMQMSPNERESWWQQNNPDNGRTPSEGGPGAAGTVGAMANPFGKLGAPHAKLAPVSAAPTLSAPVGDMSLLAQARSDANAGITSRGTNGFVQYANGASITPAPVDASMGPPQTNKARTLASPYGSGSVVDTGVKGPPGRINWSNTYDPNFFTQQQAQPSQAATAQSTPPPTTVATQPSPAFSPAYNALIDKQNRPGPLPKLAAGTVIGQSAAPSMQPPGSLPKLAADTTIRQSRSAAPSLQPPGSFTPPPASPPPATDTSIAQQAGAMVRAIPGTIAGVSLGGTSGLAKGYYGNVTAPARAGFSAGQNAIPQAMSEFNAGLSGQNIGMAQSAGSQISSMLGSNPAPSLQPPSSSYAKATPDPTNQQ